MKKYVASMVIYPPEYRFPQERKYITYYKSEDPPDKCYRGAYWHHVWVSDSPIELGSPCVCGQEKAIEDNT